ncbi:MAG: DUF4276 family protein [Luteitalea sp.]|nr:DUF4276 family protein [Luteitalea sp.]
MSIQRPVMVSAAVEGIVDEAVVRKLVAHAGARTGPVYGKDGKNLLKQRINGYNNAARRSPWIVLVDLDRDAECAPPLREAWLPQTARYLCFRIAVREVEAWLMADPETLAGFLRVAIKCIPTAPEQLENPKEAMVNLARDSRRRDIRADMVPRQGSGRTVGPAYTSRLVEYVESDWRPEVAAQHAASLQGALACLRGLIETTATSFEGPADSE